MSISLGLLRSMEKLVNKQKYALTLCERQSWEACTHPKVDIRAWIPGNTVLTAVGLLWGQTMSVWEARELRIQLTVKSSVSAAQVNPLLKSKREFGEQSWPWIEKSHGPAPKQVTVSFNVKSLPGYVEDAFPCCFCEREITGCVR